MPIIGRQTPTKSLILPYEKTEGKEAIDLYNTSKDRKAQEWQEIMTYDLLAINDNGLYVHSKFGYSIPRRNGKGEVLTIRELYGLRKGEHILHTAHRTTTSSSAAKRLAKLLTNCGYEEIVRVNKDSDTRNKFSYAKQYGLERITLHETGGICEFRTRTSSGGLGEGFDLLVVDEAQEFTIDQENTLKYTVSDSKNPQIIMCGTPPTAVSLGTVFVNLRKDILAGITSDTGWAEWSVDFQTDPQDINAWYECNPSMGSILTERKVRAEIGSDVVDFNIQRLGLWVAYSQKSDITEAEWNALEVKTIPKLTGKPHIGIKYSKRGDNVVLAIGCKMANGKNYTEVIDCRPITEGNDWIIRFLKNVDWSNGIVDGASGVDLLISDMKDHGIKKRLTVANVGIVIQSGTMFERAIEQGTIQHGNQPSVLNAVSNCQKRMVGTNGGFSYQCISDKYETALMRRLCLLIIYVLWLKKSLNKK